MKQITNSQWRKIESKPFNSFKKIGWYNQEKNTFEEVARWRNVYGSTGANFGMLNLWTPLFNAHFFEDQPGNNYAGGYNKPIADLEGCLWQLREAIKNGELVSDGDIKKLDNIHCGSIDSLMETLKDYLQYQFNKKLFIVDIC